MSERVKEILEWMRSEAAHLDTSASVEASCRVHMIQAIEVLAKEMDGLRDNLDHHTHGALYAPRNKAPEHTVELACSLAKAVRDVLWSAGYDMATGKRNLGVVHPVPATPTLDALCAALIAFESQGVKP